MKIYENFSDFPKSPQEDLIFAEGPPFGQKTPIPASSKLDC
jgi:hypothetical protein